MNIFKLSLMTLLVFTIFSCSTDAINPDTENSLIANPDLIGTWTGIDVSYSGTITTISGGITTTQEIEGTNFDGTYTITFTQDPNMVTGEGLYSIEEVTTSDDETSSRVVTNLNLITSSTNWNLVDNELSMTADNKIITATISELTNDSLIMEIDESTTTTINGVSETLVKNSVFTYTR